MNSALKTLENQQSKDNGFSDLVGNSPDSPVIFDTLPPFDKIKKAVPNKSKEKLSAPKMKLGHFTGEIILDPETDQKKKEFDYWVSCHQIDLHEKLSPAPDAMQIMQDCKPITLFSKGNFSIITGAAKSRKSFLVCMLLATVIKGSFQKLFMCPNAGTVLLFDTEQSKYKVQQTAKRICNLAGVQYPPNLLVYSLRALDPAERLKLIEHVLSTTPNISFVAIDGIIDLGIDPILQADQAQNIIMKLMQWTENYQIHIACVLHYNKTVSTLLGHLGSFSHRKADAIIEVVKSKDDNNISIVTPVDCREREFSPFAFSIDQSGLPYIIEGYVTEGKTKGKKIATTPKENLTVSPTDMETKQHTDILNYVFKKQKEHGYNDLWRFIKLAYAEATDRTIGDNKAKEFVLFYINSGEIVKAEGPKKKPVYTLPGQKVLEFTEPV